jgi:hypothetical protein
MVKEGKNGANATKGGMPLSQIVGTECAAITCYIGDYDTIDNTAYWDNIMHNKVFCILLNVVDGVHVARSRWLATHLGMASLLQSA